MDGLHSGPILRKSEYKAITAASRELDHLYLKLRELGYRKFKRDVRKIEQKILNNPKASVRLKSLMQRMVAERLAVASTELGCSAATCLRHLSQIGVHSFSEVESYAEIHIIVARYLAAIKMDVKAQELLNQIDTLLINYINLGHQYSKMIRNELTELGSKGGDVVRKRDG